MEIKKENLAENGKKKGKEVKSVSTAITIKKPNGMEGAEENVPQKHSSSGSSK